jgi:2-C-methyl-D-erythritol 4-phosphate cytidylyltransferase/2-C-methyl-D-erythritol 2,4-cyclodiphosphate synthase
MAGKVALIVAAGRGTRFGDAVPKQYLRLAGRPLLSHALGTFARHRRIEAVRAVIHEDDRALYDEAARGLELLDPVPGGTDRQDSVRLGLESLEALSPDQVLIQDGARPLTSAAVIDRVLDALDTMAGAVPGLPVTDTLKRAEGGQVVTTVERAGLYGAQTPQGFRFPEILSAHRAAAGERLTDDAAVAERAGLAVALVDGAADNLKVTGAEDLERAETLLAVAGETRVGSGFDVHRFGPGDHVMLCGVRIGHDRGLIGHSDADVGLHAATDAILGALGAGDLGDHFPPSDPQWSGADSSRFLVFARDLVAARGGRVVHLDLTLICEQPKIGPHRAAMGAQVAELLAVSSERVSIKATTTERLGFTGRGEGIAAQATATLLLPRGP